MRLYFFDFRGESTTDPTKILCSFLINNYSYNVCIHYLVFLHFAYLHVRQFGFTFYLCFLFFCRATHTLAYIRSAGTNERTAMYRIRIAHTATVMDRHWSRIAPGIRTRLYLTVGDAKHSIHAY